MPSEGGAGGKRGQSNMEHHAYTAEIKGAANVKRRQTDRSEVKQQVDDADVSTILLYRPVGEKELRLIEETGFRRFPPRLPEQPIFYPVCNQGYACEIAERWNARDEGVGFVTRFKVESDFLARYERHVVGARHHEEYWIPAEDLEAFNDAIVGTIEVVRRFP